MAFAIRNLSVLAYAQGFTLWHYRANVPTLGATLVQPVDVVEVSQPGFFDSAADMLASGDMLLVSTPAAGAVLFVTATEGGVRTASFGLLLGRHAPLRASSARCGVRPDRTTGRETRPDCPPAPPRPPHHCRPGRRPI